MSESRLTPMKSTRLMTTVSIRVGMPDAPDNLAQAAALIGEPGGNILEAAHQRASSPLSVKSTEANFIIKTQNAAHAMEVVTALRAAGFQVRTLDSASARLFSLMAPSGYLLSKSFSDVARGGAGEPVQQVPGYFGLSTGKVISYPHVREQKTVRFTFASRRIRSDTLHFFDIFSNFRYMAEL